jgi:hypothetical protein
MATATHQQALCDFIAAEMALPVSAPALAMSEVIRRRHHKAAVAVLFYGSCLRQPETQLVDSLLDFYVLVDDYKDAYDNGWLAWANQLLPPNVFYLETDYGASRLRAKYAVISLAQFQHGTSINARNVSLWARFCQPVRLTWSRDTGISTAVAAACSEAVLTMLSTATPWQEAAVPTGTAGRSVIELWITGFRATYQAELRPEGPDRAVHLVTADADRYRDITPLALGVLERRGTAQTRRSWNRHRIIGKILNVARLFKAAFTFDGGLDYVLWKVARHSGVSIAVTDWQRRHPLLAAPGLAWRLYRRGAFR